MTSSCCERLPKSIISTTTHLSSECCPRKTRSPGARTPRSCIWYRMLWLPKPRLTGIGCCRSPFWRRPFPVPPWESAQLCNGPRLFSQRAPRRPAQFGHESSHPLARDAFFVSHEELSVDAGSSVDAVGVTVSILDE